MKVFDRRDLKNLYVPDHNSSGEQNGQVTIIGGSDLFHGAPLLSLTVASRIVDMVFFSSPEKSVGYIAENIKSKLFSFIWVPWDEIENYIEKSDACLIGPGMMRYKKESEKLKIKNEKYNSKMKNIDVLDSAGRETREITRKLLTKYPHKKWVIDAGSLQTMDADWIPENAIITPNKMEFEMLFGNDDPQKAAQKYKCTIVLKGPKALVTNGKKTVEITNGNAGLTKGGTGDTLAGLTTALFAKNDSFLAASAASFVLKYAADILYKENGTFYNADDLAQKVPEVFNALLLKK